MNKVKSAICLCLMTLLVAVLCVVCFVSFPVGDISTYNSILSMTDKDADLGGAYGDPEDPNDNYLGGGYSVVYYPEGVISAREYSESYNGFETEEDKQEYEAKYTKVGSLYFENDKVNVVDGEPDEDFREQFALGKSLIAARYEALHSEDVRVSVADEYTVRVSTPVSETTAFSFFGITGEVTLLYGSDSSSATKIMPKRTTESISDYVKGAHSQRVADGSYSIVISLTSLGREALASATSGAADSSSTLFVRVGEEDVIQLTVSEKIDTGDLSIYNSSFTSYDAGARAILIDTAVNGAQTELTFKTGDISRHHALYGDNALLALYIVFGVLLAASLVYFFVRYHLLGFVHLYTYALFVCVSLLCVWAIPFLTLSVETFTAFLLASVLLSVSDAVCFEAARKEYATGKTMESSVKTGYKKNFFKLFDLHIAVALFGFFAFFVSLAGAGAFAFTLGLLTVFSGVFTLAINRFNWAIMMGCSDNTEGFCNYRQVKGEELKTEEDD